MVVRIRLRNELSDFTGLVQSVKNNIVQVTLTAENTEVNFRRFDRGEVASFIEIMSFPMFYTLRKAVAGEQENVQNISWEMNPEHKAENVKPTKKPRMLLSAPENHTYKRAWHFFQLFPTEEFEFCTKVELEARYDHGPMTAFNSVAYFSAWFAARRLRLSS